MPTNYMAGQLCKLKSEQIIRLRAEAEQPHLLHPDMETTGDPAAPLLPPHYPPPPPTEPCYGVPAAAAALQEPYFPEPPAYVLLPFYPRRHRRRGCCHCCGSLLSSAFLLVILCSAAFSLWPSDPQLTVARLRFDDLRVTPPPFATIDVVLSVDLMVRNPDFFALDYRSVVVSIGYRGRPLGSVTAGGGHIRARGVSYVHAMLDLDGIRVLNDAIYLIEDLSRGSLPLDTVTEVQGRMRLFFFDVPVQGNISCALNVNPENQEVIHQDCYSEVMHRGHDFSHHVGLRHEADVAAQGLCLDAALTGCNRNPSASISNPTASFAR
ncbi:Late embryogenesis abundant protein [Musa troglodytarum]|uniref:Late embryogenesis abundant protein n=1 Tax=Musa troglodytarum TaxID=320322 RepID=A0A9E7L1V5_9LILI|nr:Late embryogenesis abundant protein [Musa troglodytarum]